ncbi:MAG: FAD-binding oxidoreductase, partial [Armatimonadetes bacterium]|nr:FAD-binding oxidoreductase [Armatimonadota bacterium]
MTDFERDLRARLAGEVCFDQVTRGLYATDASMYELDPVAVVVPASEADVVAAVRTAAEHRIPIVPRGGGTGLAGQAIGRALIIDFSKHLNRLLELNVAERWVRVEPGLVRDELNALLAPHGLQFAPDPATGNRANVGGMVANNASGTRSLVYGKTIDKVLAAKVLLADGTILELSELDADEYAARAAAETREGEILRGVRAVIDAHRDEIRARYPKILRRSSGYMLDEFVDTERWNLARLLCASEGTLGTLLEVTLALDPIPRASGLVVVHFTSLLEAIGSVEPLLQHGPSAIELLDHVLLSLARENLQTSRLCGFLEGDPQAVLAVEFLGDSAGEVAERCQRFATSVRQAGCGYAWPVLLTAAEQAQVWTVRKSGLGLMLGMRGDAKPLAFIEDAAVPVTALADYIEKVLAICARHDTPVTLYAHASVGLLHVRPILNLKSRDDLARMKSIADECFELVLGYGGSFSGEHGDGLVRSGFIPRYFGPRLTAALGEIKRLFDPQGLMNPGKIVAAPAMDADLRYGPDYQILPLASFFHFRHDGGLAGAVEMCNGVGACRKTLVGTMCPSYIATRDEEHSTRGRANALRLAMTGRLGPDGFAAEGAREALDLCLSCKGCKAECPSNVDMARLKSEFLQHYHDRHGVTLRDRLIGGSPRLAGLLSGWPAPLANALAR